MAKGVTTVHLRGKRGVLAVQAFGRSPRGTKFIIEQVPIKAKSPRDPDFLRELETAVQKLLS